MGSEIKKNIYKKIAAAVAVAFSLLTIVEGSKVMFGLIQQEYIVFSPLLIYNILMGIVGLIAGAMIWLNHKKALMLAKLIVVVHLIALIIVGVIYITSNAVAMHSVQVMSIRVVIWLIITSAVWKTN